MSGFLRRKVDQQLGFCSDLQQIACRPAEREALSLALCRQLEQVLCFYLLELAHVNGNRRWSHTWVLDAGLLLTASQTIPGADIQELLELSREPDSWLAILLDGLSSLRRVDESPQLKAELFQSDLEISQPALIASFLTGSPRFPDWEELVQITYAIQSLVQRQRLGHEEY